MRTFQQAFYQLSDRLEPLYDKRESAAIAHEYLGFLTGLDRTSRLLKKDALLTSEQESQFEVAATQLSTGMPLQYVTQIAWFLGMEFYVDERVLIPRPETEELVLLVESWCGKGAAPKRVLDIGTGSGCIAVSLGRRLPENTILAIDKSPGALEVARKNAGSTPVTFERCDFLDAASRTGLGVFDAIVSNPPYIPQSKATAMHTNVKDFEPGMALFVPNEDPMVFYRAMTDFCNDHLAPGGRVFCEVESSLADDCRRLFTESGYETVTIHKDMHSNDRMLEAYH